MGDVNIPKPPPNAVGAKVNDLIESGHEFYATTVTGSSSGRVRRPTLFIIAMAATGVGMFFPPSCVLAIIAMVMLAYTDQVVTL